jgi:hypothetical protein
LNYKHILPQQRFQFNQKTVKWHLRSDLWALREETNNLIGLQQNIFEGQNRLGFSSHPTSKPSRKAPAVRRVKVKSENTQELDDNVKISGREVYGGKQYTSAWWNPFYSIIRLAISESSGR